MAVTTAKFKYVRITPQKVRPILNVVNGKNVQAAMDLLTFSTKRAAPIVKKLIKSAVANANVKGGIDLDNLYISQIYVGHGPTLKRFRPRARGMAGPVLKKTSHITVELTEK